MRRIDKVRIRSLSLGPGWLKPEIDIILHTYGEGEEPQDAPLGTVAPAACNRIDLLADRDVREFAERLLRAAEHAANMHIFGGESGEGRQI